MLVGLVDILLVIGQKHNVISSVIIKFIDSPSKCMLMDYRFMCMCITYCVLVVICVFVSI